MPSKVYTNKDLDKFPSLSSKSRTYTNKDLPPPPIMDVDMPPSAIEDVPPPPIMDEELAPPVVPNIPPSKSFWEQINTPLIDAPSRIARSLNLDKPQLGSDVFADNTLMGNYEEFANKLNAQIRGGIQGGLEGVGDLISQTTTPFSLATAGLLKAAPALSRIAGKVIEPTGKFIKRHTPISGMPGGFALGRNAIKLERAAGRGTGRRGVAGAGRPAGVR